MLQLRLGVTGHRWTIEPRQLRERVRAVLDSLMKSLRSPGDLIVVSPLAEGSDRLVAAEALELGATLECPLPLDQPDYERDFRTAGSVRDFRRLLGRASVVWAVAREDEATDRRTAAYAAVGSEVVGASECVLAIWDGRPSRGEGGTARVVTEALAAGRPVLWIDVDPPHDVHIVGGPEADQRRPPYTLLAAALTDAAVNRVE